MNRLTKNINVHIVLKRDPTQPLPDADELAFDRIRSELSDTRRNEGINPENRERLAKLKKEVAAIAGRAEQQDRKDFAAIVYNYLRRMPTVLVPDAASGVRISGYKNTGDPKDPYNIWAHNKALDLVQAEPNLLFSSILREFQARKGWPKDFYKITAEEKKIIAEFAQRIEKIIQDDKHELLWPNFYESLAYKFIQSDNLEKACYYVQKAYQLEPKASDYNRTIDSLSIMAKRQGITFECSLN